MRHRDPAAATSTELRRLPPEKDRQRRPGPSATASPPSRASGDKAVEALVAARAKAGKFPPSSTSPKTSTSTRCTKSILEILVKAGGLDSFGARRSQLWPPRSPRPSRPPLPRRPTAAPARRRSSAPCPAFAEKAAPTSSLPTSANGLPPTSRIARKGSLRLLSCQVTRSCEHHRRHRPLRHHDRRVGSRRFPTAPRLSVGGIIASVKAIDHEEGQERRRADGALRNRAP